MIASTRKPPLVNISMSVSDLTPEEELEFEFIMSKMATVEDSDDVSRVIAELEIMQVRFLQRVARDFGGFIISGVVQFAIK